MILTFETISAIRSSLHDSIHDETQSIKLDKRHNLDSSTKQLKRFEFALQQLEEYNVFRIHHNVKIKANKERIKFMSENGLLSDKSKVYREDPEKGKR